MFRTQNRVYSSNIDVVLCMLPPECMKLLIYADVIRGHVIIQYETKTYNMGLYSNTDKSVSDIRESISMSLGSIQVC